jgi:hypothetical protein
MTTKKKLPIASRTAVTPASAQRELAIKPVKAGSRPEFPTRSELYRKAGMIGTATLLASGLAYGDGAKAPAQAPPLKGPVEIAAKVDGPSIDGKALAKSTPKINVYREGGGIGPSEDMWDAKDVEAFVGWTMAREGNLSLYSKFKLDFDGVKITVDGFDPQRNIGFAYTDPHDNDNSQYTPEVKAKFDAWMKSQKAAILFIEVKRYPDAATLKGKIIKFLHSVQKAPPGPGALMQGGK